MSSVVNGASGRQRASIKASSERRSTSDPSTSDKKWKLLKSRLITASGNFSVQYTYIDLSWSGPLWIRSIYGMPAWASEAENSVLFVGTIVGMLGLGFVGDMIGRNRAMLVTISLMIFGNLACALLPWGSSSSVWVLIIVCRFIFGIGAGGVYPLAANKAAEDTGASATLSSKAAAAGASFFFRAPAVIWAFIFGYILALGPGAGASFPGPNTPTDASVPSDGRDAGWQVSWRLHLAFGALPLLAILPNAIDEIRQDGRTHRAASSTLRALRAGGWARRMVGTGGSWMCFNFPAFGTGLLQPYEPYALAPSSSQRPCNRPLTAGGLVSRAPASSSRSSSPGAPLATSAGRMSSWVLWESPLSCRPSRCCSGMARTRYRCTPTLVRMQKAVAGRRPWQVEGLGRSKAALSNASREITGDYGRCVPPWMRCSL